VYDRSRAIRQRCSTAQRWCGLSSSRLSTPLEYCSAKANSTDL